MSAGVTYEGALQASGETATIFQGKRFWVSNRVPTRLTWVNDIKSNGGRLEPLEKNADYLIADHAKSRFAPPGSVSWKWIHDSVAAGRLLDADEYSITKDKAKPEPSQPGTREGRTLFTAEDDRVLIAFVRNAAEKNESLLGLKMYKDLAAKNPRHTFQSWRDRWVKKLRFIDGVLDGPGGQPAPVSQPPQAEQSLGANPNLAPNPSRPSAAAKSPRPSVASRPPHPSPAAASTGPGPGATAGPPRPRVAPEPSQPKAAPVRPRRSTTAESPRPVAPTERAKPGETAGSQRPNVMPDHASPSAVAESSRPWGTPEHAKPSAAAKPRRPTTAPTPPQPTVPPAYVPSGTTPQPSRPSEAPESAWSTSVAPQPTPVNTVMRSPELSSTLKRKSIFTEEEDYLLTEYVQEMLAKHGKDADASLRIFADFELDFPQHSARVWRHRWIRYFRPRLFPSLNEGAEEGSKITATPQTLNAIQQQQVNTAGLSGSVPSPKPTTPETRRQKGKAVLRAPVSDPAHSRSIAPDSTPEIPKHVAPNTCGGQTKDTSRQTTLSSPAGQRQYLDNMSEPSLGANPQDMDEEEEEEYADDDEEEFVPPDDMMERGSRQRTSSHAFAEPSDNPVSDKQRFYLDYETFWWRANGDRRERFNSWPTIRGRTFDLFDLWEAATSQPAVPEERDWEVIAENLGFDWVKLDGVQRELAIYFEEHLGAFEDELVDYEDGDDSTEEDKNVATPEPEVPGEQSQTGVFNERGPGPPRQPFNSSPPKLPSLKRTQGAASLAYPEVEPKRRRFDKSTEISSTPDHKNGTAHLRKSSVSAAVSPSDRRISTLPRSSRSPAAIRQAMGSPSLREARKAVAEPETQDFHYDPDTQNNIPYSHSSAADRPKSQSDADVTASQQLTLESEGFVEVTSSPHTFKKPRGAAHVSPLRRQVAQDPILDSADNEPPAEIPKPRFGMGRNPLLPAPAPTATKKRQSLPWTQDGEVRPDPEPAKQPALAPARASARPRFIRPPRSDEPSSPAARAAGTPDARADSPDADAAPVPPSCDPREVKYLRRVLREWERRGYARDVALRGLDATTWATDDISGDVIDQLQRGEPVPDDWYGVWTEVDDGRLAIVDGRESHLPKLDPERLARRRDRAKRRLERKFDASCMNDRRHWLSMKYALREANMQL